MQGTIDNKGIVLVFDGIAMITTSAAWREEDATAMAAWASQFVLHLQSGHCTDEQASLNNHGTYFDVQYLSILIFLGRCARPPGCKRLTRYARSHCCGTSARYLFVAP